MTIIIKSQKEKREEKLRRTFIKENEARKIKEQEKKENEVRRNRRKSRKPVCGEAWHCSGHGGTLGDIS